jgi:hypothetical protein
MCRISGTSTRSNSWPMVNSGWWFENGSDERKAAKPAITINGPNRLSGRRHHATRPAVE